MSPPNSQPALPAEADYTDLEQGFISEQPKNLWPQNQNSNFGAIRKITTDLLQMAVTTLEELALEQHIATASGYLGRWEADLGLSVAPTGRTEAERRAVAKVRLAKGPFTRTRRREIVESYITATFGASLELTPTGLPLTSDGLALYSEPGVVTSLYSIVENVEDFSYVVSIQQDVDPDLISLQRELRSITPAHINFTIVEVP